MQDVTNYTPDENEKPSQEDQRLRFLARTIFIRIMYRALLRETEKQ